MSDDYHDAQTVRAIDKLRDLGRTDLAESVSRTLQMSKERRAQIVDDNNTIIALRARVAELEAALAKREAVAGGVVWQARHRGCSEWSDVGAEHAERLRICSRLVRAVVVVSPESDIPIAERAMLAASQQAAKPDPVPEENVMIWLSDDPEAGPFYSRHDALIEWTENNFYEGDNLVGLELRVQVATPMPDEVLTITAIDEDGLITDFTVKQAAKGEGT